MLRADVSANVANHRVLLRRFGLFRPPGIIFFDCRGQERPYRVIGFEPAKHFVASRSKTIAR